MSIPQAGLDRPSSIHAAVIEVYEALHAVIFTAFPTTTLPTRKAPADEAGQRLERLCAAISRFPDRRLTTDPFVRPDPVRLEFSPLLGPSLPPVDGTSYHDALIRLAGRIHDGLAVVRLREITCPSTGETFMGADYPNGYEYEGEVVIGGVPQRMPLTCPGSPAMAHYSELPWSAELWDRLYASCRSEFFALCSTNFFNPHPGTLRVALEHEAALVGVASIVSEPRPQQAAVRLSAIRSGLALDRLDAALTSGHAQIVRELDSPPTRFRAIHQARMEHFDICRFLSDIGEARRECHSAGISFDKYDPVLESAKDIYTQLKSFKSVPVPEGCNISSPVDPADIATIFPPGHGNASIANKQAFAELNRITDEMHRVIGRIVAFVDACLGEHIARDVSAEPIRPAVASSVSPLSRGTHTAEGGKPSNSDPLTLPALPSPLRMPADFARVRGAIRGLLDVYQAEPVRYRDIGPAWDRFRAAFCDPNAVGPADPRYSVDSNGWPDLNGLPPLIRLSDLPSAVRDALEELSETVWKRWPCMLLLDDADEASYRTRIAARPPDFRPVRDVRKLLREVLELLARPVAAATASVEPATASTPELKVTSPDDALDRNTKPFVFARHGDGFFIRAFREEGHFASLKGLRDLYTLLQSPGKPVAMRTLVEEPSDRPTVAGASAQAMGLQCEFSSRQETFDSDTNSALQDDEERLMKEVAEATEAGNDVDREDSQRRLDELRSFRRKATGIGRKSRDLSNRADKLRPKIHGRIKDALQKLREAKPSLVALADHLDQTVTAEGVSFIYNPPAKPSPPEWDFSLPVRQ